MFVAVFLHCVLIASFVQAWTISDLTLDINVSASVMNVDKMVSSPAWSVLSAGEEGIHAGLATGEIVRVGSATVPEQVVCIAKSAVMNVAMHPVEPLVLATYAHAPAKTWVVR